MAFPKTFDDMRPAGYAFQNDGVCKGCGADIEWWLTPLGKKIPMDPMDRGVSPAKPHWSTCPEAESFRGGAR